MAATESRDGDLSLRDFLVSRARHSSDGRLALDAGAGFIVTLVAVVWRGPGWHLLACAGLCFMCYGGWGIADRELLDRGLEAPPRLTGLRVARAVAAAVGTLSALIFVLGSLFVAFG